MMNEQETEETNQTKTDNSKETQNHDDTESRLPGVLTEGEQEEPQDVEEKTFKTTARSLEVIPIESIEHFQDLPDYISRTEAEHPIIARTPDEIFCIDGWNLVEAAKSEGKTTVLCEVDYLEESSREEICLRKGGIRSLTRGGNCSYAEMLRNTKKLLAMLLEADDDLRVYGHGGKRYGDGFTNNREDDARYVLSLKLGRDRGSINGYINNGEYLDAKTLDLFIQEGASKQFFEKVQAKKRIEIKNLKGKEILSNSKITRAISKFMRDAFLVFKQGGERRQSEESSGVKTPPPKNPENVTEINSSVDTNGERGAGEDEPQTTAGNTPRTTPVHDPHEEPVTIELIKTRALELAQRIASDLTRDITLDEVERRLQEEIKAMTSLLVTITSLKNSQE